MSGGGFASGMLAKAWPLLEFDEAGRARNLDPLFVDPLLRLTDRQLDIPLILRGLLPWVNPVHRLARILDESVFEGMSLQDLPADGEGPRFVFNASEMATGTLYRFSRPYMGSYRIGLVRDPVVPVAAAVAASAAFPPIMSPYILKVDPATVCRVEGADLWPDRSLRSRVALLDGGAYDNLALEPIEGRCHVYLVSDAGGNYKIDTSRWKSWYWTFQLKRTLDMATSQARALRKRALFLTKDAHPFALWRTLSEPEKLAPRIDRPFPVDAGWPRYLAALKTGMRPFSEADRCRLINWGYLTSDLALRKYIWSDDDPPRQLPYPEYDFRVAPASSPPPSGPNP